MKPLESGFDDPTLPGQPGGQGAPCPEVGSDIGPPPGLDDDLAEIAEQLNRAGYLCNHCNQHFPGYAQYWGHKCNSETTTPSAAPTPPTEAVEAAMKKWELHKWSKPSRSAGILWNNNVLMLKMRPGSAQRLIEQHNEAIDCLAAEVERLREQLAAAQAEARELREALQRVVRLTEPLAHSLSWSRDLQQVEHIEGIARAALDKKEGRS